jgi:mannose-6-phosphate isomerase-like protein (cupin superfamily)
MSKRLEPRDMKFVPKSWGWELWITNSEKYCGKILFIKAGHECSFHHHKIKDEVLFVHSGECAFVYSELGEDYSGLKNTVVLKAGEAYHVEPNFWHQMHAITDVTIFETSTQHFDTDSYRDQGD